MVKMRKLGEEGENIVEENDRKSEHIEKNILINNGTHDGIVGFNPPKMTQNLFETGFLRNKADGMKYKICNGCHENGLFNQYADQMKHKIMHSEHEHGFLHAHKQPLLGKVTTTNDNYFDKHLQAFKTGVEDSRKKIKNNNIDYKDKVKKIIGF
jgi:hypothetical protein